MFVTSWLLSVEGGASRLWQMCVLMCFYPPTSGEYQSTMDSITETITPYVFFDCYILPMVCPRIAIFYDMLVSGRKDCSQYKRYYFLSYQKSDLKRDRKQHADMSETNVWSKVEANLTYLAKQSCKYQCINLH